MKPSSESSGNTDSSLEPRLDLELPEGPGFRMLPPQVPLPVMLRRIRELRAAFPHSLRSPEERWREKTTVVFKLKE